MPNEASLAQTWPDSQTFWRDKRVIVTGGSGLLGSFIGSVCEISSKDLLETIARPTGFEGRIVWGISKPNPSTSSGQAASHGVSSM